MSARRFPCGTPSPVSPTAPKVPAGHEDTLAVIDEALKCAICFNLCDRPVTVCAPASFPAQPPLTPPWPGALPAQLLPHLFHQVGAAEQDELPQVPRNYPGGDACQPAHQLGARLRHPDGTLPHAAPSTVADARFQAKRGERPAAAAAAAKLVNSERPDEAFVTDRAVRGGKANASSGRIFVTVAPDHFGPIPASADPERNLGVRVGEAWPDRLACRQWGAHFPHVAGIAGQSCQGAQSVALSGG